MLYEIWFCCYGFDFDWLWNGFSTDRPLLAADSAWNDSERCGVALAQVEGGGAGGRFVVGRPRIGWGCGSGAV